MIFIFPFVFASTITYSFAPPRVISPNEIAKEFASTTFEGTPLMKVAFCESSYRQFNEDGDVLQGDVDNDDIGFMQINTRYHQAEADTLGLDLRISEGNILFARWLYNKQGLAPWKASKTCYTTGNDK